MADKDKYGYSKKPSSGLEAFFEHFKPYKSESENTYKNAWNRFGAGLSNTLSNSGLTIIGSIFDREAREKMKEMSDYVNNPYYNPDKDKAPNYPHPGGKDEVIPYDTYGKNPQTVSQSNLEKLISPIMGEPNPSVEPWDNEPLKKVPSTGARMEEFPGDPGFSIRGSDFQGDPGFAIKGSNFPGDPGFSIRGVGGMSGGEPGILPIPDPREKLIPRTGKMKADDNTPEGQGPAFAGMSEIDQTPIMESMIKQPTNDPNFNASLYDPKNLNPGKPIDPRINEIQAQYDVRGKDYFKNFYKDQADLMGIPGVGSYYANMMQENVEKGLPPEQKTMIDDQTGKILQIDPASGRAVEVGQLPRTAKLVSQFVTEGPAGESNTVLVFQDANGNIYHKVYKGIIQYNEPKYTGSSKGPGGFSPKSNKYEPVEKIWWDKAKVSFARMKPVVNKMLDAYAQNPNSNVNDIISQYMSNKDIQGILGDLANSFTDFLKKHPDLPPAYQNYLSQFGVQSFENQAQNSYLAILYEYMKHNGYSNHPLMPKIVDFIKDWYGGQDVQEGKVNSKDAASFIRE